MGYFLLNHFHKYQLAKVFLLGMSLWFYSYFNVKYLPVILLSIGLNYLAGIFLLREGPGKAVRRLVFLSALLVNIGALFYFKYFDFFLENLNTALKTDFNLLHLALPLGISFFTFQQLAFLIDSYRRDVPKYPLLDYALFVAFFPKILQGPIALHSEMIPQFQEAARKSFCYENFSKGLMAVAFGLAKKVLLADTFGKLVDWGYADVGALDTVSALLVMLAYTLQIYFDFSGYCDVASGICSMLNIELPMNFNSPYKALTVYDFWKRWHITLTRFFRTYIYFPLGGSRKGTLRTYFNIFLIFFVSGIWHGANWNFIFWGLYFFVLLMIEKTFLLKHLEKSRILSHIYVIFLVMISWAIFALSDMSLLGELFVRMFSLNGGIDWIYYLRDYAVVFVLCVLASTPVFKIAADTIGKNRIIRTVFLSAVLLVSVAFMVDSTYSPFLYFNF